MSARQTIDGMRFAKAGEELSGVLRADALPRLADILSPDLQDVQYRLRGGSKAGRPVLRLEIQASVVLTCQRCLEPYVQALNLERVYPLARDEAELERWERDDSLLEGLVADPKMGVAELIEDEILLSLPTVPRHPEGECERSLGQDVQVQ